MEENQPFRDVEIDSEASANLMEVSRWGRLLGILILVGTGLVFLLIVVLWSKIATLLIPEDLDTGGQSREAIAGFMLIGVIIVMLIAVAIVGVLMMFLIKGAIRIRNGLLHKDQLLFNSGLANIRNFFVMYGILCIIQVFFSLLGLLAR